MSETVRMPLWPQVKAGLKLSYALLMTFALLYGAVALWDMNLAWYGRLLDLRGVPLALILLGCPAFMIVMERIDAWQHRSQSRVLRWRIFRRNINFVPMDYWFLRVPFLVLLYLNLPVLACIEEFIFRDGWGAFPQRTLWQAIWRSVAFGYAHMLGGSTVGSCLAATLGGLWFSLLYAYGGLPLATLGHLVCNLIGLTLMLVYWVWTGKNPFRH